MRSETQMMEQILAFARQDERVRAVGMEGSRLNPKAFKDEFQDFDITFLVTEMEPFKASDSWLDAFGPRRMMQKPEAMALFPPELGNWFSYLILFADGRRMDLTLVPLEELPLYLQSESLLTIILDKDGLVPKPPVPSDASFCLEKPSVAFYDDCCNDFWYTAGYVARGLCRKETLFAAAHLNEIVRPNLLRMIRWQVGIETGFTANTGKADKYLQGYLSADHWEKLLATYRNDSQQALWQALFGVLSLFREFSQRVGEQLGYRYPDYDEAMTPYLEGLAERFGEAEG